MRQQYFILVLAHSLHGRLRRVHVPHQVIYGVLALAIFGSVSLLGMVTSYVRMALKVSSYNSLRQEVDTLKFRYKALQKENTQKQEQLASLEVLANEVTIAYGIKHQLEGPADIAGEGPLVPDFKESLDQYNFLKSASFSRVQRNFPHQWQTNTRPSLWPVTGRLLSTYGGRTDPFSGEGAFHPGVDLSASMGTPVKATADGIVIHAEWSAGGYGNWVVVDHGSGMSTVYAHLSRFDVVPGQEVHRGDIVARSGATGRATSPHLHYEVRMGGTPVNPYPYLAKAPTSDIPQQKDLPF